MKNKRIYQGVELSKKEAEWVSWFEQGSNDWWNAFYQYKHRKQKMRGDEISKSWFNSVLKKLKAKDLFLNVPFAFISTKSFYWVHPGLENSGFKAESLANTEEVILTYNKSIL